MSSHRLRTCAKRAFDAFNFTLRRSGFQLQRVRNGWARLPTHASGIRTVIDVGAANGTYPLYEAFPGADLVLIEPLVEFEPALRSIVSRRRGTYHLNAVSSTVGEMSMHVDEILTRSSFERRSALTSGGRRVRLRPIPTSTLDVLMDGAEWRPPYLLKIDTEGHEISVLDGAERTLRRCEIVVVETSIAKRFEGSYHFEDLINNMTDRGFRLVDVIAIGYAETGIAAHLDAVFRSEG